MRRPIVPSGYVYRDKDARLISRRGTSSRWSSRARKGQNRWAPGRSPPCERHGVKIALLILGRVRPEEECTPHPSARVMFEGFNSPIFLGHDAVRADVATARARFEEPRVQPLIAKGSRIFREVGSQV